MKSLCLSVPLLREPPGEVSRALDEVWLMKIPLFAVLLKGPSSCLSPHGLFENSIQWRVFLKENLCSKGKVGDDQFISL